ncbi:MAG: hypothetical protein QNJ57_05885 [Flavobacteriaceae bacterium]|nr:hypothetical protein [Flavobacteriaceae bacterium]
MRNSLIVLMFTISLLISCSNESDVISLELVGTIKAREGSTFQYGTHLLITRDNFFALYSEELNLDDFINQTVTIEGTKIEGYPVENGPDFIKVTKIK